MSDLGLCWSSQPVNYCCWGSQSFRLICALERGEITSSLDCGSYLSRGFECPRRPHLWHSLLRWHSLIRRHSIPYHHLIAGSSFHLRYKNPIKSNLLLPPSTPPPSQKNRPLPNPAPTLPKNWQNTNPHHPHTPNYPHQPILLPPPQPLHQHPSPNLHPPEQRPHHRPKALRSEAVKRRRVRRW